MFIKWSTVDMSREFLYSVLSLDKQAKTLSQQEDETAKGFHGSGIQGM
ncbi:hypothetical protein P5673_027826 [Acropora cervicornis]|uniref:Uncharacterized protein n=1 Tax=Acropora cervicornis TaxID=6130 RepID=A0AAD9PYZ3_ACRCE|nr:hypothetical protein P5673_027826 [Acropora cervicornis]